MKKLFVIMTLFVSSFFLFKEEVKADVTITESQVNTIINEYYLSKRDSYLKFARDNNFEFAYVSYQNKFYRWFYTSDNMPTLTNQSICFPKSYYYTLNSDGTFSLNSEVPTRCGYLSNMQVFDISHDLYDSGSFNIIYGDRTFVVDSSNPLLSYYHLYRIDNPIVEEEDSLLEIKEVLDGFYSVCIDRIEYLVTEICNNYIYLSIITIFILIFVIELIRRHL